MSQAKKPLPSGPDGPERDTSAESSCLTSLPCENKDEDKATVGELRGPEHSRNQNIQADTQDQPIWGNCSDGNLIRTQPQCLPQPNVLPLDKYKEGTSKKQNSPRSLKSESGFCNGVKVDAPDNLIFSAPVSQKIHRKIQSSLSVNTESSKKSSAYSHKPGPFPEDCCVHCILACLFCEFVTVCGLMLEQTSCGICSGVACCCGEEMGDDCNCPCDMDCGIVDACCESSDCLEICMECCGICFPS
uniref:MyoD family inhibitor domain-containing protein n=1 Tax=Micrurus spixii TaxID=129469 RepID=A0A2D4MH08_9SAUR